MSSSLPKAKKMNIRYALSLDQNAKDSVVLAEIESKLMALIFYQNKTDGILAEKESENIKEHINRLNKFKQIIKTSPKSQQNKSLKVCLLYFTVFITI